MPGTNAVLAGDATVSTALESALNERGVKTSFHAAEGLARALVSLERELEDGRPDAAVAVGTGEAALALAVTASKLGVPLAAAVADTDGAGDDRRRILTTLASLDAGSDPERAADLIVAWLAQGPPATDLD